MPHTYTFNPPVRGNKAGPLLRIRLCEPLLDKTLSEARMPIHSGPYRKSRDVENLLDDITFRIRPKSGDDALLMVSLGLAIPGRGTKFEPSPLHIHSSPMTMSPDVLLAHSADEDKRIVKISAMDELSVLAVALLRELGEKSYLSSIQSAEGGSYSGLAVLDDETVKSFIISGSHPSVSKLTIFEDSEVADLLRLLRAHNGLRQLFLDLRDSNTISTIDRERYHNLILEFALGARSAHHLVRLAEEIFIAFTERFPELLGPGKDLS